MVSDLDTAGHMKTSSRTVFIDKFKPIKLDHIEPNGKSRVFHTKKELRDRCTELGVESSALL